MRFSTETGAVKLVGLYFALRICRESKRATNDKGRGDAAIWSNSEVLVVKAFLVAFSLGPDKTRSVQSPQESDSSGMTIRCAAGTSAEG